MHAYGSCRKNILYCVRVLIKSKTSYIQHMEIYDLSIYMHALIPLDFLKRCYHMNTNFHRLRNV